MSRFVVFVSSPARFGQLVRERAASGAGPPAEIVDVTDEEGAARVLLAALAGSPVIAHVESGRLADRLCDDLRRLGRVLIVTEDAATGAQLSTEERECLRLLGEGLDRAAVAGQLHLSLRTLDRRLASARNKLGAATLAQAVEAARSNDA